MVSYHGNTGILVLFILANFQPYVLNPLVLTCVCLLYCKVTSSITIPATIIIRDERVNVT